MDDEKLLKETEVARLLSLRPQTLAKWRWAGKGPAYRKIGGAVRYVASDLEDYIDRAKRESTCVPGREA